jgi:hypothetical protein
MLLGTDSSLEVAMSDSIGQPKQGLSVDTDNEGVQSAKSLRVDSTTVPSQPTLQALCEQKALELDLESDFESLEPRLQHLLFNKVRAENARLREIERKWERLTRFCPSLDTQIYLQPNRGLNEEDGILADDEKRVFTELWYYKDIDDDNEQQRAMRMSSPIPRMGWDSSALVSESPDEELGIFVLGDPSTQYSRKPPGRRQSYLRDRISSQLLFYRLAVTFGMPPPVETDGYKVCWEINLQHHDESSTLEFYDYKGSAEVRFFGSNDASDDALKLVNFLVGMECLHTYDWIVAGTIA